MMIKSLYRIFSMVLSLAGLTYTIPALAERPNADPTRPPQIIQAPTQAESRADRLRLASIWFQRGRGRARIDGKNYYVGDQVGPWTVHAINASTVQLMQQENELVLAVFAQDALKRVRDNK